MTAFFKLFSWDLYPCFLLKFSPSQGAGEYSRSTETVSAGLLLFITNNVTVFSQSLEFHNSKFCQESISLPVPMAHCAHQGSAGDIEKGMASEGQLHRAPSELENTKPPLPDGQ